VTNQKISKSLIVSRGVRHIVTQLKALGAGYTSDFMCDFMSDLLQIADAIWCICNLVSHTALLPLTRSMRYGVAI
jgi:hypothetical protein